MSLYVRRLDDWYSTTSHNHTVSPMHNWEPLTIGGRYACTDWWCFLNGMIDDLRIYDRALTGDEIDQMAFQGLFP